MTIQEFNEMISMGCNSECIYGKKCLSHLDISEMSKLKETFWGKPNQRAYLPKKRKEMIANIFTICQATKVRAHIIVSVSFKFLKWTIYYCILKNNKDGKLSFKINDKMGQRRRVCEASFLFMLGLIRSQNASSANSMWKAYKKFLFEGGIRKVKLDLIDAKRKDGRAKSEKLIDAELFIRKIMLLYGDTLPTAEGTNAKGETVYVIPYERVKDLFNEYVFDADLYKTPPSKVARYTCFRKAFKSLEDQIRLLGCKGAILM